jgi:hypothetical protein
LNYKVVTPLLTGVSRFLTFMSWISTFLWMLRKVPVECLPSKHEVLSSNPSIAQKGKRERSSYWVVDNGFKFRIMLPQHLECCDYRCELSHLGNLALFNKITNFCLPNFYIFFCFQICFIFKFCTLLDFEHNKDSVHNYYLFTITWLFLVLFLLF